MSTVENIIVYPPSIDTGIDTEFNLNYLVLPEDAENKNVSIYIEDNTVVNFKSVDNLNSHISKYDVCCAYEIADSDYAPASNMFDSNDNTYWHSDWKNHAYGCDSEGKHWINVYFDTPLIFSGFDYKPKLGSSAGAENGKFLKFNVLLYDESENLIYTEQGTFTYTNIRTDVNLKHFAFKDNKSYPNVKHVKIEILEAGNNNSDGKKFASCAGLFLIGSVENIFITLKVGSTKIHVQSIVNKEIEEICQISVFSSKEPTELDYNEGDRIVQWKADIYFNGLNNEPLSVNHANYLIDADLLEEAFADGKSPFGNVTSNEITLTLLNENGIFSPTKEGSPYYDKIKKGVPIHLYCRPSDQSYVTWDELGWFYVTEWTATITGITASVTANDKLYNVFEMPMPKLPVAANKSFVAAYQEFFAALNTPVKIDAALSGSLKYFYNTFANKEFLAEISTGTQTYVFCDRDGTPKVYYSRTVQDVAHELTDADQIKNIASKQSAILDYDGAEVIMNVPQESNVDTLLSVKALFVPAGSYTSASTSFSKTPVYKITAALLQGAEDVFVSDIKATCVDVIYILKNTTGKEVTNELELKGTYLDTVATEFSDTGDNLLSVDNIYIQTEAYAQEVLKLLRAYVFNKIPVLELEVRGNAKYKLGEKLHVSSVKYAVDFTGILIRQKLHYDGGMSGTLTILNSDILEV